MTVRALTAADLPAIAALEAACFPDPWPESALTKLLSPPYGGRCACVGEAVVGYVSWLYFGGDQPEAEILRIGVSPAGRRQGAGRALLAAMLTELRPDEGPLAVYLDVRASNRGAQALYESLGFTRHGQRPRFYGDEDAWAYSLHL